MTTHLERPLSALDVIYGRRSVRAYERQTPEAPTILALLDAAVQAPTALHAEPWAFVVVQNAAALKRCSDRAKAAWAKQTDEHHQLHVAGEEKARSHFADLLADADFSIFYDADTLIAICAKPMGPFVVGDCWLAADNLMLAAAAMGSAAAASGRRSPR